MGRPRPAYDVEVLSSRFEYMQSYYDTVVVGSGYGGSIAAARLAAAEHQVCILERGHELHPGEYPSRLREAISKFQIRIGGFRIGSRAALFDFRFGKGVSALVGSGLGGTSLINANVVVEPAEHVWDSSWPEAILNDRFEVAAGMHMARTTLGAKPLPQAIRPLLPKVVALEKEARALDRKMEYPDLAVNFTAGTNAAEVRQGECRLCGDCCSGCNYGAKNTTLMNYLPIARARGATIFTEIDVHSVEPVKNEKGETEWLVHFDRVGWGQKVFCAPHRFVRAKRVILAAGTLGSTAILLRSKERRKLRISECIGKRFSGNGDVLSFAYNGTDAVNGVGLGERHPDDQPPVGPTIGGMIRHEFEVPDGDGNPVTRSMLIEEGSGPGAISRPIAALLLFRSLLAFAKASPNSRRDRARWRRLLNLPFDAYRGAVLHTQTHLVMTEDAAKGELSLNRRGHLRIDYAKAPDEVVFAVVDDVLHSASEAIGAVHISSPLTDFRPWTWVRGAWHWLRDRTPLRRRPRSDLVTVHPLGGCVMADDCTKGVVDHRHRVFTGEDPTSTYDSLFVMDGAVVPRSLGANPLLTISGLAERACRYLLKDLAENRPRAPQAPARRVDTLGLGFTESLEGPIDCYADANGNPLPDRKTCFMKVVLDMEIDDIEQFVRDEEHQIGASGVVECPYLFGKKPAMIVALGKSPDQRSFAKILIDDRERVNRRNMIYDLHVVDQEGRRFHIEGLKMVRDHLYKFWRLWDETTIMRTKVAIVDANGDKRPIGEGDIRVTWPLFFKQVVTQRALNVKTWSEDLIARSIFLRWFTATVGAHVSPVFAPTRHVSTEIIKKCPPRARHIELHEVPTADNVKIQLTRYGNAGGEPVLLAHGLGVSSRIFTTTSIEENLVEHLVKRGFDVWALDNRVSTDLPELCAKPHSGEDIARWDYPAALDFILTATGKEKAHVFAHCWGAATFLMSVLGGHVAPDKIRSLITSQVGTHLLTTWPTRLKAGVHAEYVLHGAGVENLTAYTDAHARRLARLFNFAVRYFPVESHERCRSAVCHRITAFYSLLYRHDNLAPATHERLHEMFGTVNLHAIRHLAEISRQGKLVDFEGGDVYLPNISNLRFPYLILHGAENFCFKPDGTRITVELLQQAKERNPEMQGPYERRLIPGYGHIDCIFGRNAAQDVYPIASDFFDNHKP